MIIAVILLGILNIILLISYLLYRRQVAELGRQTAFLKSEKTNRILTVDLGNNEIKDLVNEMNSLIIQYREAMTVCNRKDQQLKETITGLSHDIRTPLTSMDGYLQLLTEAENEQERKKYLTIISNRVTSLQDILEELFTYTKLQNEDYVIERTDTLLNQLVFDSIFTYYDSFEEAGIRPDIMITEQECIAYVNEASVKRVLQNIIKNSLSHGLNRVEISLKRTEKEILFTCQNDFLETEKIDKTRIFEKFYRADTARRGSSTGLGLAIAKSLTEKMDGKITADVKDDNFIVTVAFPCK